MSANEQSALMSVSDNAAKRIAHLIDKQGDSGLMLRVSVNGGGCSGFQYSFSFDDEIKPDDEIIEHNGITVLVDSMSVMYLAGSEIDFVEDLIGSAFAIKNPNATAQCGCGNSFAI